MAPTIEDGAIVLYDRTQTDMPRFRRTRRQTPGIYVFLQSGELRMKRIVAMEHDFLALQSDNYLEFPPEIVQPDDRGRIKILGKVVWWDNRL